jgi:hypothetical protein
MLVQKSRSPKKKETEREVVSTYPALLARCGQGQDGGGVGDAGG